MHFSFNRQHSTTVLLSLLLTAFIVGIAGALQTPTLSRYLTDEVKAAPFLVGLFYSINAVASIIVSFMLAQRSDKKGDRRNVILFCCLMAIGNSVTFAFTRHYMILVTLGILFSSLASSTMPQIFAIARDYASKTGRNVVAFNSILRAQLSLAWVIGPPLSFVLATSYGFTVMYLCAAFVFMVAMIMVIGFFPSSPRGKKSDINKNVESESILKNHSVIFLFIATVFMWTANMMYLIDMPLYVDKILGLSASTPGLLMGIAAGLEIPIMLIAGFLVPYLDKRKLFLFAVICGILFYVGMLIFTDKSWLMGIQIFNALFIGIVASIGIIYFQDLLPNRMGIASTLFSNGVSCSVILAGLIQGLLVSVFGHEVIYWIALVMLTISFGFCLLVRLV